MTVVRFALRVSRLGVVATSLIGFLSTFVNSAAYPQVIGGGGPAERAAFAQQMALIGQQISYLVPPPIELDTLAGYVQWRAYGSLPMFLAAWALLAASGAFRGDEERGLVEQFLAAGASRARYVASRALAFALLAIVTVTMVSLGTAIGSAIGNEPIPLGALAQEGVNLFAFALACFAIAALAAQFIVARRGAAGIGAIVLGALFALNSAARFDRDLDAIRWVSPFALYERTQPLLRAPTFDAPAVVGLLASAAVLLLLTALAFARRDAGRALLSRPSRTAAAVRGPSRDPFLRLPVVALLDQQRVGIAVWGLALSILSVYLISLTRTIVDAMLATPAMRAMLARLRVDAYDSFVGVVAFGTLAFIISIFAIGQVAAWVGDERDGRYEQQLASPVSRERVVLERAAALLLGAAIIVTCATVATVFAARAVDIALDVGEATLAAALLLPLALAFCAVGAALVGWRPDVAVPALGAVAFLSYFVQQFAPVFDWPQWLRDLSLYELYGRPLTEGPRWEGLVILLAVSVAGLALGVREMRRRDLTY